MPAVALRSAGGESVFCQLLLCTASIYSADSALLRLHCMSLNAACTCAMSNTLLAESFLQITLE